MIGRRHFADNLPMNPAKTTLNMIRAALIFAVAVYMYIGEKLAVGKPGPINTMLFQIMAVVAVINVVLIFIIRRSMVAPPLDTLRDNQSDATALNRWRTGYLITYVLCEAVALYGFILRIMGFSFRTVVPFYLASVILMIYFGPRTVEAQPSTAAVAK